MTSENQDFEVWQGDDKQLRVSVTDPDTGDPKGLSGVGAIEWVLVDTDGSVLLSKTLSGGGITVTDANGGVFTVTLDASDTAAIDPGYFRHEADVEDAAGDSVTVTVGTAQVHESHV